MENRGKRQAASIFGGMGFYIALLVCVLAAGVVGYFALLSNGSNETVPDGGEDLLAVDQMEPVGAEPVLGEEEPSARPVIANTPVAVSGERPEEDTPPVPETVETQAPVEIPDTAPVMTVSDSVSRPEEQESISVVSPILGQTVAVFAADELVYDATLGDWRTHNGIDIEAPAGTAVSAAAAGAVLSVEEDSRMGTTVTIQHSGGYVTTYASLQPEVQVALGDSVSAGTVIGTVGNTSLTEAGLGAHLHFSVSRDGEAVDPEEFLNVQ